MNREVCSSSELQGICLRSLKVCPGFEHVNEILIHSRGRHLVGGPIGHSPPSALA